MGRRKKKHEEKKREKKGVILGPEVFFGGFFSSKVGEPVPRVEPDGTKVVPKVGIRRFNVRPSDGDRTAPVKGRRRVALRGEEPPYIALIPAQNAE